MQTTIVKWGNSQGIRLPKILLDSVHMAENDVVQLETDNNTIILKKRQAQRPYKTLRERFANCPDEYLTQPEIGWGPPEGDEIW